MPFGTKILTTAFVTGQDAPRPKDIDIRDESYEVRSALKGKSIPIIACNTHTGDVSEALLKVTSTCTADLVKAGTITLPNTVDPRCVKMLLEYLKVLTKAKSTFKFQLRGDDDDMETRLGVCHAAEVLGMDNYVDNIVRKVDAILHGLPSYEDLDLIIKRAARHPRFYNITVQTFALKVRNWEIPDPEYFEEYLNIRASFAQAITEANDKHEKWIHDQAEREQRERQRAEKAAAAANREKQEKEHLVREKQYWAGKKTHDAKLRKSTEEKMRASGNARKFTPEERTWYVKNQGKQPPKGC